MTSLTSSTHSASASHVRIIPNGRALTRLLAQYSLVRAAQEWLEWSGRDLTVSSMSTDSLDARASRLWHELDALPGGEDAVRTIEARVTARRQSREATAALAHDLVA